MSPVKCPIDGSELRITDRQGIEIDYCPQCRGVWLDRGELDKIIERTDSDDDDDYRRRDADVSRRDEYRRDDDHRSPGQAPYKKKRKRSMLEDLFDFG